MSDYHIRATDLNLKSVNVVFHIPIPDAYNLVGVNWQTALVLSLSSDGEIFSALVDITQEELDAMKAGSILEKVTNVRFSSTDLTNPQRLEQVEAAYTATKNEILAEMQVKLNFYGKLGDVL